MRDHARDPDGNLVKNKNGGTTRRGGVRECCRRRAPKSAPDGSK